MFKRIDSDPSNVAARKRKEARVPREKPLIEQNLGGEETLAPKEIVSKKKLRPVTKVKIVNIKNRPIKKKAIIKEIKLTPLVNLKKKKKVVKKKVIKKKVVKKKGRK